MYNCNYLYHKCNHYSMSKLFPKLIDFTMYSFGQINESVCLSVCLIYTLVYNHMYRI